MKDNYFRILSTGYCTMQHLLYGKNAIAYTCGTYGWNADFYEVNGILICTGYRPIASKNVNCSYEKIDQYEKQAQAIQYDYKMSYEEKIKKIDDLLQELLKEIRA